MGGEIVAVTGSQSPALLSSARRSVLDRATAPQSSALRNPDTRWGSRGDLRPLMGAEVVTPEEPHPNQCVAPGLVGPFRYVPAHGSPARPRPGFHLRAERRPADRRGRGDRLLEGVRRPRVGVFGLAARSWTKCW